MVLYVVTIWKKSGEITAATCSEIRDAVEQYNEAVISPDTKFAYLSETWATFPNRG